MNLNQMKRIASKSDHELYLHSSLIFAGSRYLVGGYNGGDLHAEMMALKKLENLLRTKNTRRPRNLHMINFMVKRRSGNLGISKPCSNCHLAMSVLGVKTCTYFDGKDFVTEEMK